MKYFRWLYCLFGVHYDVKHYDDRGPAGEWTCKDCGYYHAGIVWPKPPSRK